MAFACIGTDSLPTEERGEIGMIKPSGWHTVRYDDLIEDKYLYNRCHLIAFELSGENACLLLISIRFRTRLLIICYSLLKKSTDIRFAPAALPAL